MGDNLDQPATDSTNGASAPAAGGQFTFQNDILVLANGDQYVRKERFTGLQGKVQELTNQVQEWKAKYTDVSTDVEGKTAEFKSQLEQEQALRTKFETDLQELLGVKTELETKAQQAEKEKGVMQMVMSEFPELAPDVAKGVYNIGEREGDDLRDFFKEIQTSRQQLLQQAAENYNSGSSPDPAPGGNDSSAPETLQGLTDKLMGMSPGHQDYQATYARWMDAVDKADN